MGDRFAPLSQPESAVDMDQPTSESVGSSHVPLQSQRGVQCCGSRFTERRCMVTLLSVLVILVVLAFGLFLGERVKSHNGDTKQTRTCQSQTCVQLSASFMTAMNAKVDPCNV
jgi:hypothetical protein